MPVEVLKHDGPGRLGIVEIGGRMVNTPSVDLSVSPFNSFFQPFKPTSHDLRLAPSIPLGFYTPDHVVTKAMEMLEGVDYRGYNTLYLPALRKMKFLQELMKPLEENDFDAVYIGNSKQLVREYRTFVQVLRTIRERFPGILVVMDLEPFFYPLAVYLGVDAFDVRSLKVYDMDNKAFTAYSPFVWENGSNSMDFARQTINLVRRALKEGKLRYVVENFLYTPSHEGILRVADLEHWDYLEEYTPIGRRTIKFIGSNSMRRPEVRRWRSRVSERFEPPRNTKLILLLPCSARKPYSLSRSHALYRKSVREALGSGRYLVHELILTSPLGVVPREWEWLADYDVVVTGHWSREEVESTSRLLATVLRKYSRGIPVVAHVDGPYTDVVEMAAEMSEREVIFTKVDGSTTTRKSLCSLKETLEEFKNDLKATTADKTYRRVDGIRKIFDYYLGYGAGMAVLPDGGKVSGRRMLRLTVGGKQMGTLRENAISLTPFGMQRVYDSVGTYWVNINFDLRGDVFAVGVDSADEGIRPGDIVGVVRDGTVVGVGRAVLSGREMVKAGRGVAVKVRKRAVGVKVRKRKRRGYNQETDTEKS